MADKPAGPAEIGEAHAEGVKLFLGDEGDRSPVSNVVGVAVGQKWTDGRPAGGDAVIVLVTQKVDDKALPPDERIHKIWNERGHGDASQGKPQAQVDVLAIGEVFAGQTGQPTPRYGQATTQAVGGYASAPYAGTAWAEPRYSPTGALPYPAMPGAGPEVPMGWLRPALGGCSVGHWLGSTGTMATAVYDLLPGSTIRTKRSGLGIPRRFYMLSNNHVLANSNVAAPGDPILQPGPYQGGRYPADVIGRLSRFMPIVYEGRDTPRRLHRNLVDAAIAEAPFDQIDREVQWIGRPRGWRRVGQDDVDLVVQKTGSTTHLTFGRIVATSVTVDVDYPNGRVARFRDQILTTPMSEPGDSGSLVMTMEGEAIGLLFAAGSNGSLLNQIANVRSLLRVEVTEPTTSDGWPPPRPRRPESADDTGS